MRCWPRVPFRLPRGTSLSSKKQQSPRCSRGRAEECGHAGLSRANRALPLPLQRKVGLGRAPTPQYGDVRNLKAISDRHRTLRNRPEPGKSPSHGGSSVTPLDNRFLTVHYLHCRFFLITFNKNNIATDLDNLVLHSSIFHCKILFFSPAVSEFPLPSVLSMCISEKNTALF